MSTTISERTTVSVLVEAPRHDGQVIVLEHLGLGDSFNDKAAFGWSCVAEAWWLPERGDTIIAALVLVLELRASGVWWSMFRFSRGSNESDIDNIFSLEIAWFRAWRDTVPTSLPSPGVNKSKCPSPQTFVAVDTTHLCCRW